MHLIVELVNEEVRHRVKQAEQQRSARHLLTLRRARRMEHKAEQRMLDAWRRAAELRGTLESADY